MTLLAIIPVLTHSPVLYEFAILYPRLRCLNVLFCWILVGTFISLLYHDCDLIDGLSCLYPLPVHRQMDHIAAEAQMIAVVFHLAPFRRHYIRVMLLIMSTVILIFTKLLTDTIICTAIIVTPLFLASLPRMWRIREFQLGVITGALALVCFYLEPDDDGELLHSLWHLLVYTSIIFLTLAILRFTCDEEDCRCTPRIPLAFWDAPLKSMFLCRPWVKTTTVSKTVVSLEMGTPRQTVTGKPVWNAALKAVTFGFRATTALGKGHAELQKFEAQYTIPIKTVSS